MSIAMVEIIDCWLKKMIALVEKAIEYVKTDDCYGWKKDWCLKMIIHRLMIQNRAAMIENGKDW